MGTKLDLVNLKGPGSNNIERRVSFQEAQDLAKRLNLAGFIETSAKQNQKMEDINDCFRILAVNKFGRQK